tara:strand:+ start:459 stop:1025 length:567 start_codon:yes stop_codon:yes gene_type:complete
MELKKLISKAIASATLLLSLNANAGLVISDIEITSTSLSFDVTGTLDVVNLYDLDSLFFGDATQTTNLFNSINGTYGLSKNSGTYDFSSTGGSFVEGSYWGEYLFTNGADILVVGDVIDISVSWTGSFNVDQFNWDNFVVQAGHSGNPVFNNVTNQIAGGVELENVPEPSTLAILGLGIIGLAFRRAN